MYKYALPVLGLCLWTGVVGSKSATYESIQVTEVTSIYYGDTFKVNIEGYPAIVGEKMPVRIWGVDTPEIRRPKCEEEKQAARSAKQFTVQWIRDHEKQGITLSRVLRGKYFRFIATVTSDGENLGQLLIDNGHGVAYYGGTRIDWCKILKS